MFFSPCKNFPNFAYVDKNWTQGVPLYVSSRILLYHTNNENKNLRALPLKRLLEQENR